ncbi:MAG: 50S ribosomal protein L22 [Candidatus Latescibacterota bacterium]|nr:MAG: 50S ribosomal protein L22 [Candidatus Latescibacterota bacterium]
MEAKAQARYSKIPPRKARAVLELIRGRGVEESLRTLQGTHTRGARTITKLLNSAVANALAGEGTVKVQSGELFVKAAWANEGPALKRFMPRAMGRATRIRKRTSHITIVVGLPEGAKGAKSAKREK